MDILHFCMVLWARKGMKMAGVICGSYATAEEAVFLFLWANDRRGGRDGLPPPRDEIRRIFDVIIFLSLVSCKSSVPS